MNATTSRKCSVSSSTIISSSKANTLVLYSCTCGAQFCYQCSAKWKTCACYHAEFDFNGTTNANFRAANPHITSEMDLDQESDSDESTDVDMEAENNETVSQPANSEMVTQPEDSEMEAQPQEQLQTPDANMDRPQSHPDQPTKVRLERNSRVPHRMHYPMDSTIASNIIETTAAALSQNAPKPGPQFPPRNWACPHNDYWAVHRSGPFSCADCAVIQTQYILECKKCKIHLCVRCSDLYRPRDWWVDGPPRGRSKAARSQQLYSQ